MAQVTQACMLLSAAISLLSQIDYQRSFRAVTNPHPLPDVSRTAGTSVSKDTCYQQLVDALSIVLRGRDLAMTDMDEGRAGLGPPGSGISESAIHEGMRDRDIAALDRLRKGEPWIAVPGQSDGDTLSAPGAGSTYYFPIVVNGRIDRVLKVRGGDLPEDVANMTSMFCRQTGLSIENLVLRESLAQKFDRLVSIAGWSEALMPIRNYNTLLNTILEKSADLLLAEQGSLMMIEQETESLLLEAAKGPVSDRVMSQRVKKGVGIAGRVAELGEPLLVADVEKDPRVGKRNDAQYKTPSFVSVPLKSGDRVVGVMNFSDKSTGELFDEDDLHLAQAFASHAAIAIERSRLFEQARKLQEQAITDDLTHLLNRRYVLLRLHDELTRSQRHSRLMCILMLDIDGFKRYNDSLGHPAGDRILKRIADIMMSTVRSMDIVGRYGGDEFLVILPETDSFHAMHIAERLRDDIDRADMGDIDPRMSGKITVSIGIACFPAHGTTSHVLIEHADEALYAAKARGKNRIVVY